MDEQELCNVSVTELLIFLFDCGTDKGALFRDNRPLFGGGLASAHSPD
jgi:hypothetical protein